MPSQVPHTRRWATDLRYCALDYNFRIRTNYVRFGKTFSKHLVPFLTPLSGDDIATYTVARGYDPYLPIALFLNDEELSVGQRPSSLLAALLTHINRCAISSVKGSLALHAGVVSLGGRGVILPAPPNSGKTTLVAGLVKSGFSYLSDEVAIVDLVTGRLSPYPRALAMEGASLAAVFGKGSPEVRAGARKLPGFGSFFPPSAIRPSAIGDPCPVTCMIAPRYEAGTVTRVEPMSKAEAVMWMAGNAFNLKDIARPGMHLLRDVAERSRCHRLRFGDLQSAVDAVAGLLSDTARPFQMAL